MARTAEYYGRGEGNKRLQVGSRDSWLKYSERSAGEVPTDAPSISDLTPASYQNNNRWTTKTVRDNHRPCLEVCTNANLIRKERNQSRKKFRTPNRKGNRYDCPKLLILLVETRGIEPLTSAMPLQRSPS